MLEDIRSRTFEERCEAAIAKNEASDLTRTVSRLLARNAETVKMAEVGRPPKPKNVFEIDFPAFVY